MPEHTVTIGEIESAINAWSVRRPSGADNAYKVCKEVRHLADLYGVMIYERQETVARDSLTEEQLAALASAGA